jgi:hypothetical protein
MNDLLEAKLTIARIKTQLLDLTGELFADESAGPFAHRVRKIMR